ncbi:RHS repeat-associated core domain-containing protein [Streptomyces sp. NPDC057199]|uniref:RHS repeat-associated core domain-containing protein n=1 Tax=Streptomyces sp. NPDC057199 TaxID=3346047 RepID=UPI003644BEEF
MQPVQVEVALKAPRPAKPQKAMTLKQRREQVRRAEVGSIRSTQKPSEPGHLEHGSEGATKRPGAGTGNPANAAEPGYYQTVIPNLDIYDSEGNLVSYWHKFPQEILSGFTPIPGEEYTLKGEVYYDNDKSEGGEAGEEEGPQSVGVKFQASCSPVISADDPAGIYHTAEVILTGVPSHIHGPLWNHLGDTPPPVKLPGVPISFKYKYDPELCAESYRRQIEKGASQDDPYKFEMNVMDRHAPSGAADNEWPIWEGSLSYGSPVAGVSDNQTYGTACNSNSASTNNCQSRQGHGVNTATGAFGQEVSDAVLAGVDPVALTRSYSSDNTKTGPQGAGGLGPAQAGMLGQGWSTPWEASLIFQDNGDAVFHAEDGSEYSFAKSGDGFTPPITSRSQLAKTADGYALSTRSGGVLEFDSEGLLLRSATKLKKTTTYKRDTSGKITSFVTPDGKTVDFTYADSRLAGLQLSDGRSITYGYTSGRLSDVNGPNGKLGYTYDSSGRLDSIKDQRGNIAVKNTYDSSGRVEKQEDATGSATNFSYQDDETDVTAPDGGIWTDIHKQNVLIAQYDPFGNKTSYGYSFGLDPVAATDALGNVFRSGVDGKGRLNSFETPLSKKRWGYRSDGNLNWYQNGNKKSTGYKYSAEGRLTSAEDFLDKTQTFTYTASGQLETLTDPRGKTTSFGYDTAGNQTSVTYPNHDQLTRGYDRVGRVTSVTDPRGNTAGADPAKYTTVYTYDAAGRLDTSRDAKGHTTDRDYDPAGNLTLLKDAAGKATTYTYDAANRLKDTTDAAKNVSSLTYDPMGHVSSRTDAASAKTTYTYDKAGRVLTVTTPRGNVAGADPAKYTWIYGYDKVGNQTTVTDPLGKTTKTDYDAESRPVLVTDPLGHKRATKYDADSNIVETKDALSKATTFVYDANSQLKSVTDPDTRTVSYGYDDAGNLTSETSPLGNKTTYGYDGNGRLTDTVEPRGNIAGASPAQYTWHTSYDAAGNVASVTDPLGNTTARSYDEANNLTRSTDARKNATDYGYNEVNRLTSVQAPDSGKTVLTYDEVGNLKTRTDAKQHITAYEYDKASRLTKSTDPLLRSTSFEYDPDGNRNLVTNARGQTQTNTFDARNLLTRTTYSDGTPSLAYTYDDASRPKTITDGTGTRTLSFDDADRPLSITSPGATNPFKYTYTSSGQAKTRTYPDGYATSYDYDTDGRVKTQTTGGKTITYGWDEAGNLTSTLLPTTTALTEARSYDRAGRLASISEGTGARQITRDANGRVVADQFKNATTTGLASRYDYDPVGRLTRTCTDTAATASCLDGTSGATYDYDKVGNLASAKTGTNTVTNTYDPADQLTRHVAGSTTTDLTYDADGNLTKDATGTYGYDAVSRVKSATIGADSFAFVYDADGNRTISNKNGKLDRTTRWDLNNPLAQIATDTNSTGALIADYNYNPAGIPQAINQTAGTFYLQRDRQDSIRAVHDAAGKETYTYAYTPWGETTGKASTTNGQTSIFGYTGQYQDPYLTGRLALRARSYDPATSRFTSTDPVPADTRSGNPSPYAYANNDPANQSDPSGKCPLCVSAGIGAAFGAVLEGGIYTWQHRDGGFSWGGLAKAGAEGAVTGGVAGALMPGAGNVAARGLGFTGGRALATSAGVNAAVGAGFSWGVNQVHCRPTDPWDLVIGAAGGGSSSLLGPAFTWLKGLGGLLKPSVTVSAHMNGGLTGYAYRGLRPGENPAQGLRAAGNNADVPAWQHVVQDNDSPWISLTRDPSTAYYKYGGKDNGVVAVDLSRLSSDSIDAAAYLHVPHEFYDFAKDASFRDKEVLVRFTVDANAIVKHWPSGTSFDQILRDIAALG